jgi:hypothetical protein
MFFDELVKTVTDLATALTGSQLSDRIEKQTPIESKLDRHAGGAWVDIPGHTIEEDRQLIKLGK